MPKNLIEEDDRKQAELVASDVKAKADGKIVGRYITHWIADGQAIYRITAVTAANATIEKVDIGDAWTIPAWGEKARISLKRVMVFLNQRDVLDATFSKPDWLDNQKAGTVLHYNNRLGQYIRGTVVDQDGEKMIKPTAMVGEGWNKSDLWTRFPTGKVSYGYHVEKIRSGELCQLPSHCFFESPNYSEQLSEDPRHMPPLVLSPPPLTGDEKVLADVALLHLEIVDALKVKNLASNLSDPVQTLQCYLNAIVGAQSLISSKVNLIHGLLDPGIGDKYFPGADEPVVPVIR